MKLLKLLFIGALIQFCITSCNNLKREPIGIQITYHDNFRTGYVLLVPDSTSKQVLLVRSKALKMSERYNSTTEYTLSTQSLDYLSTYIEQKCKHEDELTKGTQARFIVTVYEKNGQLACYYYDSKEAIGYFKGMKLWIKDSPNALDFKEVVKQLDLFINNL